MKKGKLFNLRDTPRKSALSRQDLNVSCTENHDMFSTLLDNNKPITTTSLEQEKKRNQIKHYACGFCICVQIFCWTEMIIDVRLLIGSALVATIVRNDANHFPSCCLAQGRMVAPFVSHAAVIRRLRRRLESGRKFALRGFRNSGNNSSVANNQASEDCYKDEMQCCL